MLDLDILDETANKVYMFSASPIYFMKYNYWPASGTPYARIQIGDETAAEVWSGDLSFARSKWEQTKEELGMSWLEGDSLREKDQEKRETQPVYLPDAAVSGVTYAGVYGIHQFWHDPVVFPEI